MSAVCIIGNGPSAKDWQRDDRPVYACNLNGMVFKPDYLCSTDPWLQYDIIRKGWDGVCLFTDFDPLPIELQPEILLQSGAEIPADYDYIIHNPEQRADAVGWHFYSTGEKMNIFWNAHMTVNADYWQPKRAYVCFVPATITIHNIVNIETEKHTQLAPSGAYAMHHAAHNGAKVVHIYGFDSVAGDMQTQTRGEFKSEVEDAQKAHFLEWYSIVEKWYSEVEFIWHTKMD